MTDTSATSRRLRWVVGLTSTAYFMVVLDSVVVITALPRMQRDLHVGVSSLQWTVNAYGIAFAAGIITAAALGDRFGRRLVFSSGLALFTLASAACALAPNVVRADRRPHGAGTRRSGGPAAQPHDSDDGVPAREAGDDRRRLRRSRWSRRRARADRRRRDHRSDRLALDLLDQRPDRARRCAPRSAAPAGEPRRAGAARPDRRLARHRRRRRARLGADSRERCRLGQRRDRRQPRRRLAAARCVSLVGAPGRRADGAATAVCAAASSRSATSPPS